MAVQGFIEQVIGAVAWPVATVAIALIIRPKRKQG